MDICNFDEVGNRSMLLDIPTYKIYCHCDGDLVWRMLSGRGFCYHARLFRMTNPQNVVVVAGDPGQGSRTYAVAVAWFFRRFVNSPLWVLTAIAWLPHG